MDTLVLEAQTRDTNVRPAALRRLKKVPAVVYGPGQEPFTVAMDYQTFRRVYMQAGETAIIDMDVDGGKKKYKVLVQDIQFNPVSDEISHVDFLNIRMDQKITTAIPVEVEGIAPAVKDHGGVLTLSSAAIRVRCLPGDLIKSIVLDVSSLKTFHDAIHVSDLKIPSAIQILDPMDQTVATVLPPRKEEEVAVAVAAATPAAGAAAPAAGAPATAAAKAPAAKK